LFKTFIYIIVLFTFFGCKSVKIINASKQKNISGVLSGTPEIIISITLNANDLFVIEDLYLGNKTNVIKSYAIYNLSNGMILKPKEILKKGKYYIQMSLIKNNILFNNYDKIYLTYLSYGATKTIKASINLKDDLLMKTIKD
jgi:hypothetical protein